MHQRPSPDCAESVNTVFDLDQYIQRNKRALFEITELSVSLQTRKRELSAMDGL
jgi:hypothetical protein